MRLISLILVTAAGACKNAAAQTPDDPLGPISCFTLVDASNLASQSAISLCTGALSDAPGRCYVDGVDTLHQLSSQKLQSLCSRATSIEPLSCYRRLDVLGTLTEDQMIQYCSTRCAIGPAPAQVSAAACAEAALSIGLPHQTANELCAGSRSAGPVTCFLAGENLHSLADSAVVQLCAETTRCQFDYVTP